MDVWMPGGPPHSPRAIGWVVGQVPRGIGMQCPRCGFQNARAAAWCAQCGLTLPGPSALGGVAGAGAAAPLDGVWHEESAEFDEIPDERPSWLAQALRHNDAPFGVATAAPDPPSPAFNPRSG